MNHSDNIHDTLDHLTTARNALRHIVTERDRLEYMNRQINAVLNEPEIRNRFNGAGMRIIGGTRAQLYEYYDQDNKRWHEVAKVRGIVPE